MKNRHKVPKSGDRDETIRAVVREAVRRYSRRCWWADQNDMTQQAWVTALEAHQTFRIEKGDLYWYAWRAVVIQLRNYLWRQSAPVSAPQRKLAELEGVYRAALELAPEVADEALPVDKRIDLARLRNEVKDRAFALDPWLAEQALHGEEDKAIRKLATRAAKTGIMQHLHKRA